jgi:mono/diheme cytochrome c family protein
VRRLTIIFVFSFVLIACSAAPDPDALVTRGAYLVNGIVACGNCHTPRNADATAVEDMRLAGGFLIEEPAFRAYAPNITQDIETGIGSCTARRHDYRSTYADTLLPRDVRLGRSGYRRVSANSRSRAKCRLTDRIQHSAA